MQLSVILFIATGLIWFAAILGGVIAIRLGRLPRADRWLSLGNSMAGGVFLAIGLIHMLPDATGTLSQQGIDYPLAGLLCCLGFLLIFALERVLLAAAGVEHDHHGGEEPIDKPSRVVGWILLTVLSFHSFMAGVALGLPESTGEAMVLSAAIIAHKGSAAFALAICFLRYGLTSLAVLRTILIFSVTTPSGVVVGEIIGHFLAGPTAALVSAIVLATAAGTFLYIATIDILNTEFEIPQDRPHKLALCVFGFGLTALVAIWA